MRHRSVVLLALGLAGLGPLFGIISLVERAGRETGDFSLFYRSAVAVRKGSATTLYLQRDQRGEPRSVAPPGMVLFMYMPWMSFRGAAMIWGPLNVALLGVCLWALWRVFSRLDRHRRLYRGTWPWAVVVLVALSIDGMQVGQLSLLFATCWLLYLLCERGYWAGLTLMVPAAMKLYPALLWAVPLALRRYRHLLWLAPVGIVVLYLVPLLVFRGDLLPLWEGFLRHGAAERVAHMLRPWVVRNQSLDVLLLRWLTDQPRFNAAYPYVPHLSLSPGAVTALVVALKLIILALSTVAAWRLSLRRLVQPRWTALCMLGLWSVTLVLLLPENKGPYAVHVFPAWLPVLAMAGSLQRRPMAYAGACVLIALAIVCQTQLMPDSLRVWGLALVATLVLWGVLVNWAWRVQPMPASTGAAQLRHHSHGSADSDTA